MLAGDTVIDAPVPAGVPPQFAVYQVQAAPVPSDPPLTERVVELPGHIGFADAPMLEAAVENVLTVTVTDTQAVVLHVPSALTK